MTLSNSSTKINFNLSNIVYNKIIQTLTFHGTNSHLLFENVKSCPIAHRPYRKLTCHEIKFRITITCAHTPSQG